MAFIMRNFKAQKYGNSVSSQRICNKTNNYGRRILRKTLRGSLRQGCQEDRSKTYIIGAFNKAKITEAFNLPYESLLFLAIGKGNEKSNCSLWMRARNWRITVMRMGCSLCRKSGGNSWLLNKNASCKCIFLKILHSYSAFLVFLQHRNTKNDGKTV
jgi:hypothetical protein